MTNLANLPIPLEVLYAGLGGTVLALIVATIQNNWSCKVFFLLALRLAIGWHFLFEGLYKVNTHLVGPTDANPRTFSSEPYFRQAPGPVGSFMRKQFDDPAATIDAQVKPARKITAVAFAQLSTPDQAAECPAPVAKQLDDMESAATGVVKAELDRAVNAALARAIQDAKSEDEKNKAKAAADDARASIEANAAEIAKQRLASAKAKYASWIYGTNPRLVKMRFITGRSADLTDGDVMLAAPQRLDHIAWLRSELTTADAQLASGLGNGYDIEQKRMAALRTDLIMAESELARDARSFVAELRRELNGGKAVEETKRESRGQMMDKVTMWFLVGVGSCLLAGLFTRLACLLGVGFLVMTYLAYPSFPWYPQPPNTEGNPVFINKNIIEALALLALATMPTGKWMGLDALLSRIFRRSRGDSAA